MESEQPDTLNRYRRLMNELLIAREAEGGDLAQEVESAYVARLDELWWQLTEREQQIYEAELASAQAPPIRSEPKLVDCLVKVGERVAPRKAEAA
ncbi:MAG TPA: hypothetical protein VJN18_07980 [Polyangiaceae bacterium]|nr:hypothetical protein [Polyangiaceae bacterium]